MTLEMQATGRDDAKQRLQGRKRHRRLGGLGEAWALSTLQIGFELRGLAVTGRGHALPQALALAERINARAPNVMNCIKELINDASVNSMTEQLAQERNQFVKNLHHANASIGIQAFLNKAAPHYK